MHYNQEQQKYPINLGKPTILAEHMNINTSEKYLINHKINTENGEIAITCVYFDKLHIVVFVNDQTVDIDAIKKIKQSVSNLHLTDYSFRLNIVVIIDESNFKCLQLENKDINIDDISNSSGAIITAAFLNRYIAKDKSLRIDYGEMAQKLYYSKTGDIIIQETIVNETKQQHPNTIKIKKLS